MPFNFITTTDMVEVVDISTGLSRITLPKGVCTCILDPVNTLRITYPNGTNQFDLSGAQLNGTDATYSEIAQAFAPAAPSIGTIDEVSQSNGFVWDGANWIPDPLERSVNLVGGVVDKVNESRNHVWNGSAWVEQSADIATETTASATLSYLNSQINTDTTSIYNQLLSIAASTAPLATAQILEIAKTFQGYLPVTIKGGDTVSLANFSGLAANTNYQLALSDPTRTGLLIFNDANQTVFLKFGTPNGNYTGASGTWLDQRMIQIGAGATYEVPQHMAVLGCSAYYASAPNATSRLKATAIT